jgi:excisionase family DNA binding protein
VLDANRESRPSPAAPLLYHVEDAARLLAIGRTKAYELVSSGDLPSIHIGRSVRVSAAALEDWVRRRTDRKDAE